MKKNFLKITLSFVILICLLLTTACGNADDLQYRAGVFGGYRLSRTMIGIEGETDTFDIDNVNFKLFITLHQNDETPNKGMYISEGVGVFDFNFGLYVCDANDEIKDSTVSDYKNINGYKFLIMNIMVVFHMMLVQLNTLISFIFSLCFYSLFDLYK